MSHLKWHPDVLFRRLLRATSFPSGAKAALRIAASALAWYGVISSLISIVAAAKWVIDTSAQVYSWVAENAQALTAVLDLIHYAVVAWRALTAPLHGLLFGWMPFSVPQTAIDVLVIAGIVLSGVLRGWFATRQERRFTKAVSPLLSKEGRIACLKRIQAAQSAFTVADGISDHVEAERLRDKAEAELVGALDDLTAQADTSRHSDAVLDAILSMRPDDFSDWAYYVANTEELAKQRKSAVFRRSLGLASVLAGIVAIDAAYVADLLS